MKELLKLILEGEALSTEQMARILDLSPEAVRAQLAEIEAEGAVLGWRPVLNPDHDTEHVRAVIEIKISPEREGGFDRIASRIARFDRVESCYLMSGSYDLLVFVNAKNLRHVAQFVFEKLAPIDGVQATATHFMLRAYKESGFMIERPRTESAQPSVSP
mgnify:CR=1 FL=1